MLEEIKEAKTEMKAIECYLESMFYSIMQNNEEFAKSMASTIFDVESKLSCEAIQVAAMAQKFMDMEEQCDV